MQTDLSPICKALIALFAGATRPMSIEEIYVSLPDAEPAALQAQLAMLVRSTVVLEVTWHAPNSMALSHSFYYLSGSSAGASFSNRQDDQSEVMVRALGAFNAITGFDVEEDEGWLLLQLLSDVRIFHCSGQRSEDAEQSIVYATLKADAYRRIWKTEQEKGAA